MILTLNLIIMKFAKLIALLGCFLIFAGCLPSSDGIPLFSGDDTEMIETDSDVEEVSDVEPDTDPDVEPDTELEEFGYIVENTLCVDQLHGGCIPTDYREYESTAFTLPFVHPTDWVNTHADQYSVTFVAPLDTEENDPTVFMIWRQAAYDPAYETAQETLVDSGTGVIGPYDVTWEIYEGLWNEVPVKAEWVTLVVDEEAPLINYVYFLMTETENFGADQAVIKAAASYILME